MKTPQVVRSALPETIVLLLNEKYPAKMASTLRLVPKFVDHVPLVMNVQRRLKLPRVVLASTRLLEAVCVLLVQKVTTVPIQNRMHLFPVLMAIISQPNLLPAVKFVLLAWSVETKQVLMAVLMDFILMKVKCCVVLVPTATTVAQETQSPVVLVSIPRTESAKTALKTTTALALVPSLFAQWGRHRNIHPAQLVRQNVNHVLMAITAMEIRKHRVQKDINARKEVISQSCVHQVLIPLRRKSRLVICALSGNVAL